MRSVSYGELMEKHPERMSKRRSGACCPKNSLGRKTLRKLKVYAGPDHPHSAQRPTPFEIKQVAQQAGPSAGGR